MDTLISNVTVVTMNPKMDVLFGAYIGIEDGKIFSITKTAPKEQPKTIIDGGHPRSCELPYPSGHLCAAQLY